MGTKLLILNTTEEFHLVREYYPALLEDHKLIATLPDLVFHLAAENINCLPLTHFISDNELEKCYQLADIASRTWYKPLGSLIEYKGINLGEISRLNHLHFFREMFCSQIIIKTMLEFFSNLVQVTIVREHVRPCTTTSAMDGEHAVFSEALRAVLGNNTIRLIYLPPQQAKILPEEPSRLNQEPSANSKFKKDYSKKLILGYGADWDLMILSQLLSTMQQRYDYQPLLLSRESSPPVSTKRSGLEWQNDLPFLWEKHLYDPADLDEHFVTADLHDAWQKFMLHDYSEFGERPSRFQHDFEFQCKYIWDYYWQTAVKFINRFERVISQLKPAVVVSCDDATFINRILLEIARKHKILTVGIPHGYVIEPAFFDFNADLYLSQGELDRQIFIDHLGKRAEQIIPSGSAVYNATLQAIQKNSTTLAKKETILLLTKKFPYKSSCLLNYEKFTDLWRKIVDYINQNPNCEFIIKTRPERDHFGWYESLLSQIPANNLQICHERLENILPQAHIVIMVGAVGFAGLVSIGAGKPVLCLNELLRITHATEKIWNNSSDILTVADIQESFIELDRMRQDRIYRATWLKREENFVNRCMLPVSAPSATMADHIVTQLDHNNSSLSFPSLLPLTVSEN